MDFRKYRLPDSLGAAMTPPGPELPKLVGAADTDVIVIGAGFTGLSTALHLREAGVDVPLSRDGAGLGASGRNNGQVIPTLSRPDPEDIIAKTWRGRRTVRRVVARQRIDIVRCRAALSNSGRAGTVGLGAAGALARPHQNRRTPRTAMVENSVRRSSLLSREQTRAMLGSDAWFGGFWNRKRRSHQSARAVARPGARCGGTRRPEFTPARPPSVLKSTTIAGWSRR